jgi:hypothetical protein
MGFLNENNRGPSYYLEVTVEGKLVRPLAPKPSTTWMHKIYQVETPDTNGQPIVLRKFRHEVCTAIDRNGTGCTLCNTPDPLWSQLTDEEKVNSKGKRTDFPKTPVHVLPVYDYGIQDAVIMKGGNQIFEGMDQWYGIQQPESNQDLRRCDWHISKTGMKKRTKYKATRMDQTAFTPTEAVMEKVKVILAKGVQDRAPMAPDQLSAMIRGIQQSQDDQINVPAPSGFLAQAEAVSATLAPPAPPTTFPNIVTNIKPPPVAVSAPPPTVAPVTAVPGESAGRNLIDEFSSWVTQIPEFQGMGAINNMIPMIKEKLNHVEYYKLNAQQLADLKKYMELKLIELRAAKK